MWQRILNSLSLILTTSGKGTYLTCCLSSNLAKRISIKCMSKYSLFVPEASRGTAVSQRDVQALNYQFLHSYSLGKQTSHKDVGKKTWTCSTTILWGLFKSKDHELNHCNCSLLLLLNFKINCHIQWWYENSLISFHWPWSRNTSDTYWNWESLHTNLDVLKILNTLSISFFPQRMGCKHIVAK